MKILFNFLLEGSLILAIGWVFFKLVLERLTFFDWNRTVLLSLLTMVLVLPFLSFKLNNPDSAMLEYTMPTFQVGQGVQTESGITWQEALLGVYLVGLFVGLVKFSLGLAKPIFQLQLVEKYDYKGMKLAVHPSFEPASFFNYILLPKYDPEDPDQKQILLHESIHVSKKHTWDLILIQLCKAVFWFNPLVYSFEKSLREVHEFQADQGVTQSYSQIDYSRLLVKLIAQDQGWQLMNSFNQFQTKKRIVMMNKTKSNEAQKSRFLLVVPMLALMVFVFACEQNLEDEPIKPDQIVEVVNEDGSTDLKGVVNGKVVEIQANYEIFDIVEEPPKPIGGMSAWQDYMYNNIKYPSKAREMGVEGTVVVAFVINTDGSIQDPEIIKGIGAGCDEEVIRLINNAPNWEPGKQRNREVRTRMRLPIRFKLS